MKIKLAFLLGVGSLFIYSESHASALCKIVPSCESLGYSMKASECSTISSLLPTLKCPYDNSMVFCPDDCQTYPIIGDSCDSNKGTCVRCATTNRWKYIDCNEGYVLLDGECKPTICDEEHYIYSSYHWTYADRGTLISCKNGEETRYGFSSCKEGWKLVNGDCVAEECGENYISETVWDNDVYGCPDYAVCTEVDTCMAGTGKYIKVECNEGRVFESGRRKCVKNKIGSIYKYNDVPIGVVFYDDGYTTKIIALQDVDQYGNPVTTKDGATMSWAARVYETEFNCTGYDIKGVSNYSSWSEVSKDTDGFKNTQKILDFANWKDENSEPRCKTFAAKAAYSYYPDICEYDSFCGAGKWYLPAYGEFKEAVKYWNYPEVVSLSSTYWTSTEMSSTGAAYYGSGSRYPNKGSSFSVRPVLAF